MASGFNIYSQLLISITRMDSFRKRLTSTITAVMLFFHKSLQLYFTHGFLFAWLFCSVLAYCHRPICCVVFLVLLVRGLNCLVYEMRQPISTQKLGHHIWILISSAFIIRMRLNAWIIFHDVWHTSTSELILWFHIHQIHHARYRYLAKVVNSHFAFNEWLTRLIIYNMFSRSSLNNLWINRNIRDIQNITTFNYANKYIC